MIKMHNLSTVVKFEITRMIKKWSFWALALGMPLMVAVIFGVVFWSNQATLDATKKLQQQSFSWAITDDSGIINKDLAKQMQAQIITSKAEGIDKVKNNQLDGYIYFPKGLDKNTVEVYGKEVGLFQNERYSAVAQTLMTASVDTQIDPQIKLIVKEKVQTSSKMFKNGQEYNGVREMIAPGFFLVLFYLMIGFFGGQMLNSTVEEKENRTVEMLLTTLSTKTLVTGKIIGMVILAVIQGAVIILPVIIMYLLFGSQLKIPSVDVTEVVFDPLRIGIAVAVFASGFMMFTGLLVAVGAVMPTAKEASQWFSVVILLIFAPLYGATVFVSDPESVFVQFFSYFPLTSPIPLLIRNAVGNLPLYEAVIAVMVLIISAVLAVWLAVKLFRYGAMQYDSKLSLSVLRMRRSVK